MYDEIIRVWGVADSFTLEYSEGTDGRWNVSVPADLQDGQYAVEIFAQNRIGAIGFWAGILYMHRGKAVLHLFSKKYDLWLMPQTTEIILKGLATDVEFTDREG